jgi:uncharacterized protein (DUF2141 family)
LLFKKYINIQKTFKMKKLLFITMILCVSVSIAWQDKVNSPTAETGTLLVMVQGFKSSEGQLMVALYNTEKGFMNENPFKGSTTLISANQELIKFENLPYGDYAVVVLHDMNKDGKLDKNEFGIPTEGYGFSNNVMGKFGPPTWMQASFVFAGRDEVKIIDLEYGIPKKSALLSMQ